MYAARLPTTTTLPQPFTQRYVRINRVVLHFEGGV
jgi:hypothetical protein